MPGQGQGEKGEGLLTTRLNQISKFQEQRKIPFQKGGRCSNSPDGTPTLLLSKERGDGSDSGDLGFRWPGSHGTGGSCHLFPHSAVFERHTNTCHTNPSNFILPMVLKGLRNNGKEITEKNEGGQRMKNDNRVYGIQSFKPKRSYLCGIVCVLGRSPAT